MFFSQVSPHHQKLGLHVYQFMNLRINSMPKRDATKKRKTLNIDGGKRLDFLLTTLIIYSLVMYFPLKKFKN